MIAFLRSIAPSTATISRGFHPTWEGDLLIGTLIGQKLVRVRYDDAEERVIFTEFIEVGRRLRDIEMLDDGRLAAWTDSRELIFLRAAEAGTERDFIARRIAALGEGSLQVAVTAALDRCNECHSFRLGDHQGAPSLAGIHLRRAGGARFDGYSDALASSSVRWTKETLDAYLAAPAVFLPGTTMPAPGLDDEVRAAVIDILVALSDEIE